MTRLLLLFAITATCLNNRVVFAHPASHVDGWVSVSANGGVHLRLKVFLHDVVRHHDITADEVPTHEFQQAVSRHSQYLLNHLQIYEGGKPLTGRLRSPPRWRPATTHIDVVTEGTVRLQWDFEYLPTRGQVRSLCFIHQLTAGEPANDVELRLQLRQEAANRRVSAVIPPRRPVTVVLPDAAAEHDLQDPNAAVSTLIATPTSLVHEFMAPLAMIQCGGPQLDDLLTTGVQGDTARALVSDQVSDDIRRSVTAWFRKHVTLRSPEGPLIPRDVQVEYLETAPMTSAETDDEAAPDGVPLFATTIGVRTRYGSAQVGDRLELAFSRMPGKFPQLIMTVITPEGQRTEAVDSSETDSPALRFEWQRANIHPQKSDAGNGTRATQQARRERGPPLVKQSNRFAQAVGVVVLLVFAAAATFQLVTAPRRRFGGCVVLVGLSILFLTARLGAVAEPAAVRQQTQWLLDGVYHVTSTTDRRDAAMQLDNYLCENLAEKVYLGTIGSLVSADRETFIDIESVEVDDIQNVSIATSQQLEVTCSWTVVGKVHHWGHLHRRALRNSGQLTLKKQEAGWKIGQLILTTQTPETLERDG